MKLKTIFGGLLTIVLTLCLCSSRPALADNDHDNDTILLRESGGDPATAGPNGTVIFTCNLYTADGDHFGYSRWTIHPDFTTTVEFHRARGGEDVVVFTTHLAKIVAAPAPDGSVTKLINGVPYFNILTAAGGDDFVPGTGMMGRFKNMTGLYYRCMHEFQDANFTLGKCRHCIWILAEGKLAI